MSERCRTECPIWLLSKGHVACNPLVRKAIEQRVLDFMDNADAMRSGIVGSLASRAIDESDQRISRLDARLDEVAELCTGPSTQFNGSELNLQCGGFSVEDLGAITETQQQMISRLGSSD